MGAASKSTIRTHSAAEVSSVAALLTIKRLVRRTLRQVGLSGLSLMLILGLTAHSPKAHALSSYATGQPSSEVIVQPIYEKANERADERTSHQNDKRPFQNVDFGGYSSATSTQTLRPHRLLSAKMTHHHLTGSRLTIPTSQAHRGINLAAAE